MKKKDLKNFDIVETRTGNLHMVNADKGVFFGTYGWASLEGYEDDLTDDGLYEEARDYDIVRVRRMSEEYQHARCQWTEAPIIWQRKERPELSHEEEVILRALNKPNWWIARDYYVLGLYKEKPVFEEGHWWASEVSSMKLYDHLFDFVEREKGCYQIKDLIGDGKNT